MPRGVPIGLTLRAAPSTVAAVMTHPFSALRELPLTPPLRPSDGERVAKRGEGNSVGHVAPTRARSIAAVALLLAGWLPTAQAQVRARSELPFPDLPGYLTLMCDFHAHTVFSDGNVWPTVRVEEAWRQGLDAIAITDHLEYLPHGKDILTNYNRSYEIARAAAEPLGLICIRGAEITRGEPPGHWNTVFLNDAAPVKSTNYLDALKAAVDQGAFIFWNHPGWKQPDRKSVWYAEQEAVWQKGWLHGLEVVNGLDYDPIVHQWCLDRGLTLIGDSDMHNPVGLDYDDRPEDRRPVTLVFATKRTKEAIREALFAQRTAVYCTNALFGSEAFLKPLFERSIEVVNPDLRIRGKGHVLVQIRNRSLINYELAAAGKIAEVTGPSRVRLHAGKVSLLDVQANSDTLSGEKTLALPFRVRNLKTAPDEALTVELNLRVTFQPAAD